MKRTQGYLKKRGRRYYACWKHEGKEFWVATHMANRGDALKELERLVAPFRSADKVVALEGVKARLDHERTEAERLADEMSPPPLHRCSPPQADHLHAVPVPRIHAASRGRAAIRRLPALPRMIDSGFSTGEAPQ